MIGVDKIEDIRRRCRDGETVAEIARKVGVSEPTVRKYRDMEDLSPKPPKPAKKRRGGILEPHREKIDGILIEDRKAWHKQHHTALRIYNRIVEEDGYGGSCSTVCRYVKERRDELAQEAKVRDESGFLNLDWPAARPR